MTQAPQLLADRTPGRRLDATSEEDVAHRIEVLVGQGAGSELQAACLPEAYAAAHGEPLRPQDFGYEKLGGLLQALARFSSLRVHRPPGKSHIVLTCCVITCTCCGKDGHVRSQCRHRTSYGKVGHSSAVTARRPRSARHKTPSWRAKPTPTSRPEDTHKPHTRRSRIVDESDECALGTSTTSTCSAASRSQELSRVQDVVKGKPHTPKAKPRSAPKPRKPKPKTSECQICLDEHPTARGVRCCSTDSDTHFTCDRCFDMHVRTRCGDRAAVLASKRAAVACPSCTAVFPDQVLALHTSAEGYVVYEGAKQAVVEQAAQASAQDRIMREVARMQKAFAAAQHKGAAKYTVSKELLAEQLKTQFPGAHMCGSCSFGPVAHMACSDLGAHHGQDGISNACPRCGWFRSRIGDWPAWDGRLPEDTSQTVD